MDLETLTPGLASHIFDRMGSTGQPPERGARLVNVATAHLLEVIQKEYLQPMKATGRNSTFKLVQAPFGGGKTHFLHCLRELAWSEGFLTSLVGLSPKECPFDRPVLIYKEVARRLEYPVADLEEQPQQGVEVALKRIAELRIEENGADAFQRWLRDEFAAGAVESPAVARAVKEFLRAFAGSNTDTVELLGDYLRGENVAQSDLDPYRLRESLADDNAFRWLRSLVQCFAALGMPGVVLMFDEMDRNMSLGVRRRREIGDNLRQMIDYCGQSLLPGVFWCYAVPPEFMDQVVPEYPALAQRLKGASRFGVQSPMQPIIDLDQLPLPTVELLHSIGLRLRDLAERAFDYKFNRETQDENISMLARELGERQFESGTRRQFVKAAATLLDSQRRTGERVLSADDIRGLAGQDLSTGPAPMPDEVIL